LHHKCRGQDDYLSHPLQFLADFPLWGEIIWVHGTPAQNQQRHPVSHEAIYVFGRGGKKWWNQECARYQSVWFVSPERGFDGHPCPFPLEIPKRLVDSFTTKRGQLVVDPFAGRGTTLAAAAQLGRKAIGCEISPAFFEVAKRYLSEPPVLGAETQLGFLEGEEAATVGFDIGTTAGPLTLQAGWGEGASLPLPLGEGRGEGGSRAFDVPADNPSAFPHPNPLPAGEGIPSKPSPWAANDVPLLTRSTASKKPVSGRESVA
jgi:SAM-dependent methyltransferase